MLSILTSHKNNGYNETFGGDGCVYYLYCSEAFTGVCIYSN